MIASDRSQHLKSIHQRKLRIQQEDFRRGKQMTVPIRSEMTQVLNYSYPIRNDVSRIFGSERTKGAIQKQDHFHVIFSNQNRGFLPWRIGPKTILSSQMKGRCHWYFHVSSDCGSLTCKVPVAFTCTSNSRQVFKSSETSIK